MDDYEDYEDKEEAFETGVESGQNNGSGCGWLGCSFCDNLST